MTEKLETKITAPVQEKAEDVLAKKISELLCSEPLLEQLKEVPERYRGPALGLLVEQALYLGDTSESQFFLELVKKQSKDSFSPYIQNDNREFEKEILSRLMEKHGFAHPLKEEDAEILYSEIKANSRHFHAFNGVFEESIKEKGLRSDANLWDENDLLKIKGIGEKYGESMLLGWYHLNSQDHSFFDSHASNSYRYAVASPEWFAQFCAEGGHIGVIEGDRKAYYRKDYAASRKNVTDFIAYMQSATPEQIAAKKRRPNMSAEEGEELLSFFEKYWKILCNEKSTPKLALIKGRSRGEAPFKVLYEISNKYRQKNTPDLSYKEALAKELGNLRSDNDQRTPEAIPAENISFIDFPPYSSVYGKKD